MRHILRACSIVLATAVPVLAQPAGSGAPSASSVTVTHPWARASAGGSRSGAAYLTVQETGGVADRLTGASTPAAASAEIHENLNENGVMKMRPAGPISLEPGKAVVLAPGGYHVMLMNLKQPLKEGGSFPLTLTFEHAPAVTVNVPIEHAGASMPMQGMDHDMTHGGATPMRR